jgi:ATP-binding cassette subfamily B (MDR/TAP) protein 1
MVDQADEKKDLNDRKDKDKKAKVEEDDGTGFERKVGMKGGKLSGGQKQRIAIARTVIRRPKIYLFDEATSALDTESEKVVQDALNKISKNSTSLSIAHRIATIIDSDVIFVIKDGGVVEQGTYQQLMERQGEFYKINSDE